ncbi:MAG: hypothetical protein V4613_02755 [Bacteroidota bacterium]
MPLKEPHKIRVDYNSNELEEIGADSMAYNGLPFNGYVVYDYFKPEDNAAIDVYTEVEYRDGERMGWDREYYTNGHVKLERLSFYATPLLSIYYNEQGIETSRFSNVSQEDYDDMIEKYNILDK